LAAIPRAFYRIAEARGDVLIACCFPRRVFGATNSCCALACNCFPARLFRLAARLQCCFVQAQLKRMTAMDSLIGFAEVAAAIIAAMGLALALEWVSLYGLTSFMPGRREQPHDEQS
jgi:hypothetical protein